MTRFLVSITLLLLFTSKLSAQDTADEEPEASLYAWPYAARHAPRIGGSWEIGQDRVRLDIGSSLPLYDLGENGAVGVDFFTWSRLRSEENFKFPVEAIDYYFGAWGGWDFGIVDGLRAFGVIRLAHISTHLVDGEERFGQAGFEPLVYSREFIDIQAGGEMRWEDSPERGYVRFSGGTRWLFNTIPDSLGRFRPSIAFESAWAPYESLPGTLRSGMEFGLNTETESTLEFSARFSLKFARPEDKGLLMEGGYLSGKSVFGQYYQQREDYFWIGFGFGR